MSGLGKPWPKFLALAEKALGSRTRRFASESPGNDQFSDYCLTNVCLTLDFCLTA